MIDYLFIDNTEDLKRASEFFLDESTVAVDLEADSMFHFKEKVCLIQMASARRTVIIDPLGIDDMSSLKPVFADPDIRKVFHGSDYDVRSLYRDYEIEILNLFDTELASRFLGVTETGLGAVLEHRFDIKLDKSFQKKDWSKRPLPAVMIEYGACDVIHLLPLAEILDTELKLKNRDTWVKEECDLLSRVRCPSPNGSPLFLKIKGSGKLDRRGLSILERLLKLRMTFAERRDKPLFKIISNGSLLEIARKRPVTQDSLKETRTLSVRQFEAYGESIAREVAEAMKIPEKELPSYPRKKKPTVNPDVPKRLDRLKEWRNDKAMDMELDPPILFNKALLTEIAVHNPQTFDDLEDIPGIKQWQIREFGPEILECVNPALHSER